MRAWKKRTRASSRFSLVPTINRLSASGNNVCHADSRSCCHAACAAERAAHAAWQQERESAWQTLFPDALSRLIVGTNENRLEALVRFFHARMKTRGR